VASELAVVLTGGGARAAYQVGVLRALAGRLSQVGCSILTGVSAGAINAAYLATRQGSLPEKIEGLWKLWANLRADDVFEVGPASLAPRVLAWGLQLASGGRPPAPRPRSLVDTTPLRALLVRHLEADERGLLPGIERNLEGGRLKAVALTASSYSTGQSITWVQGRAIEMWERAHRKGIACRLGVDHVMASSALPIFFPAVQIDGGWYGDGGIRLTAPLSPAVHLGATKIIAISTRYGRSREEADRPVVDGYPPTAQVVGVLLNAIFLDLLDNDALRLERINRLIEHLPEDKRLGMRHVDLLVLRPSRDLGRLANEYEPRLPRAFRFLTRGLGTRETRSNDLLSLLMFQRDYLLRLLELGEADAERRADELAAFLER
jgi:NTE family protein